MRTTCIYCNQNLTQQEAPYFDLYYCPSIYAKSYHSFNYFSEDEFTFYLKIDNQIIDLSKDPWGCFLEINDVIEEISAFNLDDVVKLAASYLKLKSFL